MSNTKDPNEHNVRLLQQLEQRFLELQKSFPIFPTTSQLEELGYLNYKIEVLRRAKE